MNTPLNYLGFTIKTWFDRLYWANASNHECQLASVSDETKEKAIALIRYPIIKYHVGREVKAAFLVCAHTNKILYANIVAKEDFGTHNLISDLIPQNSLNILINSKAKLSKAKINGKRCLVSLEEIQINTKLYLITIA